jgi:hypothetical protein
MSPRSLPALLAALAVATGLAACGGGHDDPVTPPATAGGVPASATASPEAFARYVGSLAPSETAEPIDLKNLVPPVSESAEPLTKG